MVGIFNSVVMFRKFEVLCLYVRFLEGYQSQAEEVLLQEHNADRHTQAK